MEWIGEITKEINFVINFVKTRIWISLDCQFIVFLIEDYSNSVDSFEITEEYTLDTLPLWKKFHFLKKERERIVES